jgi:hypothetical protein
MLSARPSKTLSLHQHDPEGNPAGGTEELLLPDPGWLGHPTPVPADEPVLTFSSHSRDRHQHFWAMHASRKGGGDDWTKIDKAQERERQILMTFAGRYRIDVEDWDVRSFGSTLVISGIQSHQHAVMLRDYLRTATGAAIEAVEPVPEDVPWSVVAVGKLSGSSPSGN